MVPLPQLAGRPGGDRVSFDALKWSLERVTRSWCREHVGTLSPSEKLVLVALSWHHNAETGRCDPGRARIAEETGLHERTVTEAIQTLREKGLLEWKWRWWDAAKQVPRSNSYTLSLHRGLPSGERPLPLVATDHYPPGERPLPSGERPPELQGNYKKTAAATNKTEEKAALRSEEVELVWSSYAQSLLPGTTRRLTDARCRAIVDALEHSSLEELVRAVAAWPTTPYHRGDKYEGKGPQNRLEQLIGERSTVEQLLDGADERDQVRKLYLDEFSHEVHGKAWSELTPEAQDKLEADYDKREAS